MDWDEFFFKAFGAIMGLVLVILGLCCTREVYLTVTYGPRYICDELNPEETCDTTYVQQPIDDKGNFIMVPHEDCYHKCLRSHRNPNRTDD